MVCSGASSLPEVGGEAARYFDPYQVDDMVARLASVWHDDALRRAMRTQGLTQAARFSWSRTAAQTLAVYQSLLPTTAPSLI